MHLKTKKKKKKTPRLAPVLLGGGRRRPARSTSGGKRAATRAPVPLAATNQLVLHERERRASKYCDPISPRASDKNE